MLSSRELSCVMLGMLVDLEDTMAIRKSGSPGLDLANVGIRVGFQT